MSDDERLSLDMERMFPEACRRVRILGELRRSWPGIVGAALARNSAPCNLGVSELCVAVRDARTAGLIRNMKGNITRILASRYEYAPEDFALKITSGIPPHKRITPQQKNTAPCIKVDEEAVKEYMSDAPEGLPVEINYAISHLRVFLENRFPQKNKP